MLVVLQRWLADRWGLLNILLNQDGQLQKPDPLAVKPRGKFGSCLFVVATVIQPAQHLLATVFMHAQHMIRRIAQKVNMVPLPDCFHGCCGEVSRSVGKCCCGSYFPAGRKNFRLRRLQVRVSCILRVYDAASISRAHGILWNTIPPAGEFTG